MIKSKNILALGLALSLAACGGGSGSSSNQTANYTLGGSVTGLNGSLVLTVNGGNPVTVNANGKFAFSGAFAPNSTYSVTVAEQPRGQVCTVSNGSGAGMVASVGNIAVTCSASTFSIAGSVTGLAAGQSLTLQNNSADAQTISSNGAFSFATPVAANSSYAITVASQPAGQVCTVSSGSGSGVVANINNIIVACSTDPYTIGGAVNGLASGQQVTLLNNGADPQIVAVNGAFAFSVPVVANSSYAVTVGTQPTGQTCTVSNGSGAGVVANVNTIAVNCSTNSYSVSGTVSGLASGQQVTLNDNGGDALTVNANGSFAFATPIAYNGSYAVTVGTQPTNQICTVANGSGAGMVANIANVAVTCSTTTYTVNGTVNGLASGQQVTILDNGASPLTLTANGSFTFATPVVAGGSFLVSVGTQPTTQTCSILNGIGGPVQSNIYGISVNCAASAYTIGGSIGGLNSGEQVSLNLNGVSAATLTGNGTFTLASTIVYGGSYAVTVGTQPVGQTCAIANGSGSNLTGNVGNVAVSCSSNAETVLRSFQGGFGSGSDGAAPVGVPTWGSDGNLYGTVPEGGSVSGGIFYKIAPTGNSESIVYDFNSSSGENPFGSFVVGADGNYYGTTTFSGAHGSGTIYKITPSGTLTVLYNFGDVANDARIVRSPMIQGTDGNFYGLSEAGGANGNGVVFKITPGGSYTLLYSFGNGSDAQSPVYNSLVQGPDGNFYGVTERGGANGSGAVFKITAAGVETVLWSFGGAGDGQYENSNLVFGADGNLYGTCSSGGANGNGIFFKLTTAGVETILYSFNSGGDAQNPIGNIVLAPDGNFYGTSYGGGSYNGGTIFKITPGGTETVLWSFGGTGDGKQSYSGLMIGGDGHFYGSTTAGGASGLGTLFKY